jgi:hypothetical protein
MVAPVDTLEGRRGMMYLYLLQLQTARQPLQFSQTVDVSSTYFGISRCYNKKMCITMEL